MVDRKLPKLLFLAAFALALPLAGCETDSASPEPYVTSEAQPAKNYIRLSPNAPPEKPPETKPLIDTRNQIWRPGHWSYDGNQFTWVPGEVMDKPTFSACWSPDRWEKREYGWAFITGYWQ
jgi:hypothetical protein